MTTPLYVELQAVPPEITNKGNRGLWFERFFNQYKDQQQWANPKPESAANAAWLKNHFNNNTNGVVGNNKQLAAHAQAQMQLAASLQGQSHIFKANWHFVTGMGNPHPVENGFAWHPTLGVPYLTGAAVKGLVRSYIENNLDTDNPENPDKEKLLFDWFGSDHKKPEDQTYDSQAGNLIFFDALPTKPVTLGVDIMTPHMGKWYEKGGTDQAAGTAEAVPADWHDPVPVSFLVAKEITLLFSFALRQYPDADSKRPAIDLADVADVLNRALEQAGAGGKTATGYGGMQLESDGKGNTGTFQQQ
ncbi:MAG: type III-B CRISPR module RAMP protein Cmr6, partial [Gammaproteobacteria bacterium]|nr:type III-B CRISPR module RAMP protein Cmr6 [Gammaproteobacteria bacterium]MBU2006211.1 type III-B CRISPR module RAMP protein Cmr6 [Gammaproteobacteria bacterium]